jgi:putative copper export protein
VIGPTGADIVLWVHVLAATVWIGGQVVIALLVPLLRAEPALLAEAARRYAQLAWSAFAVLVMTGVINMHDAGIGIADLGSTSTGRTLGVKLMLVLVSGMAAAGHQVLSSRGRTSPMASAGLGGLSLLTAVAAALFGVVIAQS